MSKSLAVENRRSLRCNEWVIEKQINETNSPTNSSFHWQCDTNDLFRIMVVILKSPATKTLGTLLDPMTKLISYVIQSCHFKLKLLVEVCTLCNRIFVKVLDVLCLSAAET